MMSGNMLNPWAFEADVTRCTYELLRKLSIRNSTSVIDDLKTTDAYDLIPPVFSDDLKIDFFGLGQFCFIPTIDEEYVRNSPHFLLHQKTASNIPILIGVTSLESEWHMSFKTSAPRYPNKNFNLMKSINNFMTQFFESSDDTVTVKKERFIQRLQHRADMSYGIYKFIQHYIKMTKQKSAFLYRFAFDGKYNIFKEKTNTSYVTGAAHGDELGYLFKDCFQEETTRFNEINLITRDRMVTMWSNFIKFG